MLFGGAAGGGKSKAIVMEAIIDGLEHPGVQSYLFRKSYPELRDTLIRETLISIPKSLYTYNSSNHDLRLVGGSTLHFRHCRNIDDAYSYQGAQMHRLFIDELTHFTSEMYEYLKTRVRVPKNIGVKPYIRCSANPGGVGHNWVKKMFIDVGAPFEIIKSTSKSEVLGTSVTHSTQYIPATVTDNPHLDSSYIYELERKPSALKKALLYGDWSSFENQVFEEFCDNIDGYATRKYTHVIEPFRIPKSWRRFRSFDFGYTKPFSVGYWAVDYDGRLYRFAELYGSPKDSVTELTKNPDRGLKYEPVKIAQLIKNFEQETMEGLKITGVADPSIFDESRGGEGCIAKILERYGLFFERGDNRRIAGKQQLHRRLAFDSKGIPGIYIFKTCSDFIRTVPSLQYDRTMVEDVDTSAEDHIYDETRYMCMHLPYFKSEPPKEAVSHSFIDLFYMNDTDSIDI